MTNAMCTKTAAVKWLVIFVRVIKKWSDMSLTGIIDVYNEPFAKENSWSEQKVNQWVS